MNTALETTIRLLAENSLRASLLIVCVMLLRIILRGRLPAQCFHLLWLLVAVRLLLPVAPASSWSVYNLFRARMVTEQPAALQWTVHRQALDASANSSSVNHLAQINVASAPQKNAARDPFVWLFATWLGGVAVQVALLALAAWRTRRLIVEATPLSDSPLHALAMECFTAAGLRGHLRALETNALSSPAVLGLWRPRLLIPRGLAQSLTEEEMRVVLLHECAHLRRRDLWAMWALTFARIVHWFNPLAWLAVRLARTDTELACDETVLRRFLSPGVYGQTLLKVAQAVTWQQPALPSVGVLQGRRTMRVRMARIGSYSPPRLHRTVAGLLAFAVVVVAFGADEKTTPEPPKDSASAAPQEPPAWSKGWKVVRIAIPKTGQIEHAFVDLTTPAGRTVTLSEDVFNKEEGVVLEKVEWTGSPVRAKVRLRKDQEHAVLFAEAGLVSRNDDLPRLSPQLTIESKFLEISDALAKEVLPFPMDKVDKAASLLGVIRSPQTEVLLRSLNQKEGVDLLSAPRVTTKSEQAATIEIIREFRYPTEWAAPDKTNKHWTPTVFETRNVGVTLEVRAVVNSDNTLDLHLVPQVVEFLGIIDYVSKKAAAEAVQDPKAPALQRMLDSIRVGKTKLGDRTVPIFDTRKSTTEVTIRDGDTVIMMLGAKDDHKPFASPHDGKTLVAIVTARRITPDDEPKEAAQPAPAKPVEGILFAQPVEGKPGFVRSPYSMEAGYIDVRGFPSGTDVKDPYSGKIFRLP